MSSNQLAELPEELGKLRNLGRLDVLDNPALGLPAEVVGKRDDPASILNYYFSKRDSRPLNEAKMLLRRPWRRREDVLGQAESADAVNERQRRGVARREERVGEVRGRAELRV